MTSILVILLLVAVCWQLVGCGLQRKMLFPTFAIPSNLQNPNPTIPGLIKHSINTDAGTTEAWFMPGDGAAADQPQPAVIFAHGNAELIDIWPEYLAPYRALGISVMLIEYRGYGRSEGKPSQATITEDFIAGYDWLTSRDDVDADRIVFHGRSVGGGVVCALAAERPPAALILQSTFTSVTDIALRFGLLPPFVSDPFDNESVVRNYQGPTLILHGKHDSIIPYRHAEKLHAAAPNSTLSTYDCDHNDFPLTGERYWADLASFCRKANIIP